MDKAVPGTDVADRVAPLRPLRHHATDRHRIASRPQLAPTPPVPLLAGLDETPVTNRPKGSGYPRCAAASSSDPGGRSDHSGTHNRRSGGASPAPLPW